MIGELIFYLVFGNIDMLYVEEFIIRELEKYLC